MAGKRWIRRGEQPDLILLDIMMPILDGFVVLGELKADPLLRHIPVIVISAMNDLESVVKGIKLGAEDYLPKPFEPTLLHARISASLEKKSLRDQIPRFSFSCSAILFYPLIQLIKAPQTIKITPPSIKSSPTGPNTKDNPAPKTKINTPVPSGLKGAGVVPAVLA